MGFFFNVDAHITHTNLGERGDTNITLSPTAGDALRSSVRDSWEGGGVGGQSEGCLPFCNNYAMTNTGTNTVTTLIDSTPISHITVEQTR